MKRKLLLTVSAIGMLFASANAATVVTIANAQFSPTPTPGFEGYSILDTSGALTTFTATVGVDNGGSFLANGTSVAGPADFTWTLEVNDASVPAGANPFLGNEILVQIVTGDGAITFNTGVNWGAEDPVFGGTALVNLNGQSFEGGVATAFETAPGAPNQKLAGLAAGVVPEPSVALLGALGFLGLLRRRR